MDAGFSFSLDAQSGAIIHAGGNSDFQHFFSANAPSALAGVTGFGDNLAGSVTLIAGSADREKTLLIPHLAGTMAGRTTDRVFAFGSSPSIARGAGVLTRYFDLGLQAEGCLRKRYLQIIAKIRTSFRTAPAPIPENISKSEKLSEDIAKISEGGRIESAESSLQSAVTISIKACSFLGIAHDTIGFSGFLESLLGILIVRIFIRVVFEGQFPIGALDLLVRCVMRNPQNFVAVSFVVQSTIPTISMFISSILHHSAQTS
jgi:hypothetical protein